MSLPIIHPEPTNCTNVLPPHVDQQRPRQRRLVRENDEWLVALAGKTEDAAQQQAHDELSRYLFTVVQNYLLRRQPEFLALSTLAYEEIATLAEDFVQICLEKLSQSDYALLQQFSGIGLFTGWSAQIALNIARSELRKARWDRLQPLDTLTFIPTAGTPEMDQMLQQKQLNTTLYDCLNQLPEHYRTVLICCVMDGERGADVAKAFGRSNQAVYNLVDRAKKALGVLLVAAGIGPEDLGVFAG